MAWSRIVPVAGMQIIPNESAPVRPYSGETERQNNKFGTLIAQELHPSTLRVCGGTWRVLLGNCVGHGFPTAKDTSTISPTPLAGRWQSAGTGTVCGKTGGLS